MLNKDNQRELAYIVRIDSIEPITGSDNCESANVSGWHIMVRKNTFKPGDLAVYFEVDSHLDVSKPEFAFLEKRRGNIKVQKYTFGGKGNYISQGLLMSAEDFGWVIDEADGSIIIPPPTRFGNTEILNDGDFLTQKLGVTYSDSEDNIRKANSVDKYRSMTDRHKKLFKSKFGKFMMKREFTRKIMFFFFGKKSDKKSDWPAWVKKTDEERVQNMPWLFPNCETKWIATEKIDGTSTTFTMKNDKKKKLYVCSRNVVFDTPEKNERNYYKDSEGNVYLEMAAKYDMENVLKSMLTAFSIAAPVQTSNMKAWGKLEYITIQGETYGGNIQKRNYGPEHRLAVFNIIFGYEHNKFRLNPIDGTRIAESYNLEYVPIMSTEFYLPSTCDELISIAHGQSVLDDDLREGLVFRSEDGEQSFKAVDPEFILKFHN